MAVDEADEGRDQKDEAMARTLGIGVRSFERWRRRFVEQGWRRAWSARNRPRREYAIDLRRREGSRDDRGGLQFRNQRADAVNTGTLGGSSGGVEHCGILHTDYDSSGAKKNRNQAVAKEDVVHSAGSERRVSLRHGKRC